MVKSIFNEINLNYKNREYTIAPNEIMALIHKVEEVITITDLIQSGKRPPLGKIASAYATVLRYAGCKVTDEEIYQSMFNSADVASITAAITALLQMLIPPSAFTNEDQEVESGHEKK